MDNQSVIERVKYLMSEMRLRQNAFAKRIGTDISNFSKLINGKLPVSDSLVNRIVVNLGVSKQWLVAGEGTPFQKNEAPQTIVVPQISEHHKGSPVYDIDVTAGALSREMTFADDSIIGYVNVPGVASGNKIVRVSGDSMKPVINDGDYLSIREITDMSVIFWGQIYVVLLDDYRMVKYLRRHEDNSMVILRSENPQYDDIELPRTAIRGLFFVSNIIHIDSRM